MALLSCKYVWPVCGEYRGLPVVDVFNITEHKARIYGDDYLATLLSALRLYPVDAQRSTSVLCPPYRLYRRYLDCYLGHLCNLMYVNERTTVVM